MIASILSALAPIVFVVALGWLAGGLKLVPDGASKALAAFVVTFALPISLCLAAAKAKPGEILNLPMIVALLGGLGLTYLLGLCVAWLRGAPLGERGLRALTCSFPNMAYCGPPVVMAAVGASGLIVIVVGNLVTSLILVPATLVMLAESGSDDAERITLGAALWHAVTRPLVYLPVLGAVLAILQVKLPDLVVQSGDQIGRAAGGAALFALGIILSKIKIRLDFAIVFNVLVKNVVQPAIILAIGYVAGLRGGELGAAFLMGVLPTASEVSAIAVSRDVYAEESADSTMIATLFAIVSISAGIAITKLIA